MGVLGKTMPLAADQGEQTSQVDQFVGLQFVGLSDGPISLA
ncbi:hypothetical protein [Leptothoe sp. PORK10 BA2]|nr:hypothetical protein [Leptothoe sp. PORK10 BA2]